MSVDDFSVNRRIKQLRDALGMSQRDFSTLLSLSGGYIAGIEVNLRKANNRLIKLIVAEFGVNEDWLKNGNGEMFSTHINNEKSIRLVSLFNDLPPKYQDVVLGMVELLRKADNKE